MDASYFRARLLRALDVMTVALLCDRGAVVLTLTHVDVTFSLDTSD